AHPPHQHGRAAGQRAARDRRRRVPSARAGRRGDLDGPQAVSSGLFGSIRRTRFHLRLDTQVAFVVTLVVAFALTAALVIATRVVTADSRDRASSELAAAQSVFY